MVLVGTRILEILAKLFDTLGRKYRWPEHYFSVWSLENSQKLRKTKQFLVSTIFFTITNISFFSLHFDLNHHQKSHQITNNVVCVVARLVLFCCALTTGHCNAFQHIFCKLKEIWVVRPTFPDYVISFDYGKTDKCFLELLRLFSFVWQASMSLDFRSIPILVNTEKCFSF